jgi:sulfur carrier protein ThiS
MRSIDANGSGTESGGKTGGTVLVAPAPFVTVSISISRGASKAPRSLTLPKGARIRDAVRAVGLSPEGTAVLLGERPVPLDGELADGMSLVLVPTYSGG